MAITSLIILAHQVVRASVSSLEVGKPRHGDSKNFENIQYTWAFRWPSSYGSLIRPLSLCTGILGISSSS